MNNTLPYWLSNNYKTSLLKDIRNIFAKSSAGFITRCLDSIRLSRRYLFNRVQKRHLTKYETIWEIFADKKPRIILEIGSFDGLDSVELSRMFPDASILSFEPDPINFAICKKNTVYRSNNE